MVNNPFVADRFKRFAASECRGSSRLYAFLAEQVAHDEELLQLAAHARQDQPIPNLFFGAIHHLLLQGTSHELRNYYPSISIHPLDAEAAFPAFKDFCLQHQSEIGKLLRTRLVQTNEVRRCAYLYPAFCYIYEKVQRPLALIEIGTSAGLQLLWDRYGYKYDSSEKAYGDPTSTLIIRSELQGDRSPSLLSQSPPVAAIIGVDLHVVNLLDPEDYRWLRSLIWPEHAERRLMFDQAVQCLKENPAQLIEGDGVKLLPELAANMPQDAALCIFHTHVANQIPQEGKAALLEQIDRLGAQRDVFHLYNNISDTGRLLLDYYIGGNAFHETLAEIDGHGHWFRWLGES